MYHMERAGIGCGAAGCCVKTRVIQANVQVPAIFGQGYFVIKSPRLIRDAAGRVPWGERLTSRELRRLLGPVTNAEVSATEVHEEVQCDGYIRRRVSYAVPSGRASAFVCIPETKGPAPLVFCHHQHAGEFDLGKSEVCGLRGDPDQAYAAELAQTRVCDRFPRLHRL